MPQAEQPHGQAREQREGTDRQKNWPWSCMRKENNMQIACKNYFIFYQQFAGNFIGKIERKTLETVCDRLTSGKSEVK